MSAGPESASTVLAPVSPAIAALIHQAHAEGIAAAEAAAALALPPAGAIVLLPADSADHYFRVHDSKDGLSTTVIRGRSQYRTVTTLRQPEWAKEFGPLCRIPGRWYCTTHHVDANGDLWESRDIPHCDDGFGNLVRAPE